MINVVISLCLLLAQTTSVNAVYIGHSLISDVPDMVMAIAGPKFKFTEQFTPGAPLRWQWEEPTRKPNQGDNFRGVYDKLITPNTNVLVMVDSVPRGEPASMTESADYAGRFLKFARSKNPNIRVFYYEPWHDITSGTPQRSEWDKHSPTKEMKWRPRLTADRPRWEKVVTDTNRANPGKIPMRMIPVGSTLGVLDDSIAAGKVPGLSNMKQLFDDNIHLNPLGKYFVACIHYRAIFGGTVTGKPFDISNRWSNPFWDKADWAGKTWKKPAANTVTAIQKIADSITLP